MSQWSGLSATFKAQVKRKGNKPRVGIALSGVAKYYSRGKAFTMDSKSYVDELASAPSLSISAKMTGGLSTVNKLNINILNQDLESDYFAEGGSYPNPENTEVKAYLVYDSGTTDVADSIQFFKGIIDDFPEIDYKSLKITCTSIDKITFKKIGNLVTQDDAPSGFKVPEDSLGRVKPIIYGNHRFAVNFTKDNSQLATNYEFNRENNVVEAVSLGGGRFLIADHKVNSIEGNADTIWLFDEDLGKMVEVDDFTLIQNDSNGCIISLTQPQTIVESDSGHIDNGVVNHFYDDDVDLSADVQGGDFLIIPGDENPGTYRISIVLNANDLLISEPTFPALSNDINIEYTIVRYPKFHAWRSPIGAESTSAWLQTGRVYDLSLASPSVSIYGAGDSGDDEIIIKFNPFPISSVFTLGGKLYIKGNWDLPDGNFELSLVGGGAPAYKFSFNTNTTQFHTHLLFCPSLNEPSIFYHKLTGSGVGTASIYEAIQKVTYYKNIDTDKARIYFGGLGMEYGSWVNSRSGHQDNNNAGSLIENAAGCIESLMRDILSFSTIDNSSFNTASAGDLSASKLSFEITERTESDKLIHDILERVKSIGYFSYNDEFRMVVYNSSENFTEADDPTPNDDDKFLFNPTEDGSYAANTRYFKEHPIIEDSFWIKKNPANQIVTNFTIEYYKTHNGKFARKLTKNDDPADLYHDEDISKTFLHPYTKDQTTAQIWLDFLIDRLNRKHWSAGWDTWYNAIGKEMWDVVNVQHPVIASLVASYATKKWRILSLDIQTDLGKISIEVEEQ